MATQVSTREPEPAIRAAILGEIESYQPRKDRITRTIRSIRGSDALEADMQVLLLTGNNDPALDPPSIRLEYLEERMAKFWNIGMGKAFREKFEKTFGKFISRKTTEGSLERIPKRLLKP